MGNNQQSGCAQLVNRFHLLGNPGPPGFSPVHRPLHRSVVPNPLIPGVGIKHPHRIRILVSRYNIGGIVDKILRIETMRFLKSLTGRFRIVKCSIPVPGVIQMDAIDVIVQQILQHRHKVWIHFGMGR